MKKLIALTLCLVLACGAALSLTACGNTTKPIVSVLAVHVEPMGLYGGKQTTLDTLQSTTGLKIGVPNDSTNEARALMLLAANNIITLKDGAGIGATKQDIVNNPYQVDIVELEAAQIPSHLASLDYAVINSNYALDSGLNPTKDSLLQEGSASAYANILVVREEDKDTDKVKALVAALSSQAVKDYIAKTYNGSVVSVVDAPLSDGFDSTVDYEALRGTTIAVAASPTPHAQILGEAKKILAQKGITLDIREYGDYIIPNQVVQNGEIDANYFQHQPYLDNYLKEN